mgnify:FL=1
MLFRSGLAVEAAHLEKIYNSGFDGMYTYFASDTFVYGSKPMNWNHISSYCKQREMMFIPSVGPGYIDTEVGGDKSVLPCLVFKKGLAVYNY